MTLKRIRPSGDEKSVGSSVESETMACAVQAGTNLGKENPMTEQFVTPEPSSIRSTVSSKAPKGGYLRKRKSPSILQSSGLAQRVSALTLARPGYMSSGKRHTAADLALQALENQRPAADRSEIEAAIKAEQKAEAAWLSAMDHYDGLLSDLLSAPVRNPAEALEKQRQYSRFIDEDRPEIGVRGRYPTSEHGAREAAPDRLDALLADLAATTGPRDPNSPFDMAREAYEAAVTARKQADAALEQAYDAADADAPRPSDLANPAGGYFVSEDEISEAKSIPLARKVELAAMVREFAARTKAASLAYDITGLEANLESAYQAEGSAIEALLNTHASEPTDIAYQLRATINHSHADFEGEHADDELTISRLLGGDHLERRAAKLYRSALALAGETSPALTAQPFDAAAWVQAFEATPGCHLNEFGVFWTDEASQGLDQWDALKDWQKTAVRQFGKDRAGR